MSNVDVRVPEKIAWLASKPKRVKIVVGGRGSGKSNGVADVMLGDCDMGSTICAAREYQESIGDSVHGLLKNEINRLAPEGMTVLANEIRSSCGGRIFYKGLARNVMSVKSLVGLNKLWIEEGESISDDSLRVLVPSVRSAATNEPVEEVNPPEIWITMNRGSRSDAVAAKYLSVAEKDPDFIRTGYYEDEMMMIAELNWRENPWFPPELELERRYDYEHLPRNLYEHIWEGRYNDGVENALIYEEWFDACIDAHLKIGNKDQWLSGAKFASHDPADRGADPKSYVERHGVVLVEAMHWSEGAVNDGFSRATSMAIQNQVDYFTWDADGIGLALVEQAGRAFRNKKVQFAPFRGSMGVDNPDCLYNPVTQARVVDQMTNKDAFANRRGQYYGELRDRAYRTFRAVVEGEHHNPDDLMRISSEVQDLVKLREEVCKMPIKPNSTGKLELYTKAVMKSKFKFPSPNIGDGAMMVWRNEFMPEVAEIRRPGAIKTMHGNNSRGRLRR